MDKTLGTARHKALIRFLIEKREASGMTQSDFANSIGEYQSFVARLESGQRRVDVIEFEIFGKILGFKPNEFFSKF